MSRAEYLKGLALALAGSALLTAAIRIGAGPRWFGFYGPATVLLLMAPILAWLLWRRLPSIGWSRWWTLLFAVPALGLALIQIGYWTAFFTYGPSDPTLGVARAMLRANFEACLFALCALVLLSWVVLFAGAARTEPIGRNN